MFKFIIIFFSFIYTTSILAQVVIPETNTNQELNSIKQYINEQKFCFNIKFMFYENNILTLLADEDHSSYTGPGIIVPNEIIIRISSDFYQKLILASPKSVFCCNNNKYCNNLIVKL